MAIFYLKLEFQWIVVSYRSISLEKCSMQYHRYPLVYTTCSACSVWQISTGKFHREKERPFWFGLMKLVWLRVIRYASVNSFVTGERATTMWCMCTAYWTKRVYKPYDSFQYSAKRPKRTQTTNEQEMHFLFILNVFTHLAYVLFLETLSLQWPCNLFSMFGSVLVC